MVPGSISCMGNIRISDFGISLMVVSSAGSRDVGSVMLMMASPAMLKNSDRAALPMTGSFLILVARVVATLSPEISQDKRIDFIERLIRGMEPQQQ